MAKSYRYLILKQIASLFPSEIFLFLTLFLLPRVSSHSSGSPMALVPYSPPQTLAKFHQTERNFTFVGKTLKIAQDWNEGGVAAVVWDAAIVLGQYLEKRKPLIQNKTVIELGAGTGLVGMVAALLGGNVIITDRQKALKYINTNVENNADVLSKLHIKVADLTWGQSISDFEAPYDVILGADIIYLEETFEELFKTLLDLAGRETIVLLSCRIRYDRDNKFLKLLATKFNVKKVLYNEDTDIVIYKAMKLESLDNKEDL